MNVSSINSARRVISAISAPAPGVAAVTLRVLIYVGLSKGTLQSGWNPRLYPVYIQIYTCIYIYALYDPYIYIYLDVPEGLVFLPLSPNLPFSLRGVF